jgi:TolA-binding protein
MSARGFRNRVLAVFLAAAVLVAAGAPAHAASKEIIQLQTQVQQLLDMVQRLQSTLDSHFGVMQNLAQQTADQANQMNTAVANMQKELNAQAQAESGKTDAVSGQVQSLNDSVDELKTRIAKLDKSIQDLQSQVQALQSQMAPAQPGTQPGAAPTGPGGTALPPAGGAEPGAEPGAAPTPQVQAPPLKETFQAGLRDYNAGRYPLATGEFQDVVHYYPLDDLAGTAQFYLGEIAFHQQHFDDAVTDYNAVLEGFPGNAKAPAAQLHKGFALLSLSKRAEGIRELRELIRRHPQTPEANAARSRLNGMGVRISATR